MLTTEQLRGMARSAQFTEERKSQIRGTKSASQTSHIFLSHSHHDKDLIEGGGVFLNTFDVKIYVDWLDEDMPEKTDAVTAARIKQKIEENSKFVLLATPNALNSKWVPWELGIADGLKGYNHMAILPVASPFFGWTGNEYVGIYPMIMETNDNDWAVFKPGAGSGTRLKYWLTS